MENPTVYINTNVNGFSNLITAAKDFKVKKFYYVSSSSVYGESIKFPLNEKEKIYPKIFMVSQKNLMKKSHKILKCMLNLLV